MTPLEWKPGDRVTWWHSDRNGTQHYTGTIMSAASRGPYYNVKRDDTGKSVPVRTTALRLPVSPSPSPPVSKPPFPPLPPVPTPSPHGGPRTPKPGHKLGRPTKKPKEKAACASITFSSAKTLKALKSRAKRARLTPGAFIERELGI